MREIVATFTHIKATVSSKIKKNVQDQTIKLTNPHLVRISVCASPETMPVISGVEEQAHAYFHQEIESNLKPGEVIYTGRHDGSDTSEEFAYQSIIKVILNSTNLEIFPLPDNFPRQLTET